MSNVLPILWFLAVTALGVSLAIPKRQKEPLVHELNRRYREARKSDLCVLQVRSENINGTKKES